MGRVLAARRPFICNDTEAEQRVSSRITGPEGIRSFMHVPLVLGDRVYGLVSVNSSQVRAFGERDLRVVGELARHAASALQNALQFEQERHIAETLQQALIAEELPALDGLELAALYQAAAGSQVGGDFYSAWPIDDGRLAILVGDVSGKGVEAAGMTAMVRYMAEALSQHARDPAELVAELNVLLHARLPDASLVTLVLAVLDTAGDRLAWCSAGHPPPVLIDAAGEQRALEDPDPPCGAFSEADYCAHEEPFREGDVLVLYTDGIIEARRTGASSARRAWPMPCARPPARTRPSSPARSTPPPAPGRAAASPTTWPSPWPGGRRRRTGGEPQDQLGRLERHVELGAVADAVQLDPVGPRQPVLAEARGGRGPGQQPVLGAPGDPHRAADAARRRAGSRRAARGRSSAATVAARRAPSIWCAIRLGRDVLPALADEAAWRRRRPSAVATIAPAWARRREAPARGAVAKVGHRSRARTRRPRPSRRPARTRPPTRPARARPAGGR